MFDGFFSNKKVFVTGQTGFKGAWLSLWLERLGAKVHGYSLEPPSEPNLYSLAKVGPGIGSTFGDIRDLPKLEEAMASFAPDLVIHMAAQSARWVDHGHVMFFQFSAHRSNELRSLRYYIFLQGIVHADSHGFHFTYAHTPVGKKAFKEGYKLAALPHNFGVVGADTAPASEAELASGKVDNIQRISQFVGNFSWGKPGASTFTFYYEVQVVLPQACVHNGENASLAGNFTDSQRVFQ